MKITVLLCMLIISFLLIVLPVNAQIVCTVADPTGTPLNVRMAPQGKLRGTLPNGLEVDVIDITTDKKGNEWAKVGGLYKGKYQEIGWVFKKYLKCNQVEFSEAACEVQDPTGTPLNVRSKPHGKIVRTLKNKTEVYVQDTVKDNKGNPWAKVAVYDNGNMETIGWVFKKYLFCP